VGENGRPECETKKRGAYLEHDGGKRSTRTRNRVELWFDLGFELKA
jgi:hypothetical protein